jgi:hypothetical protein
MTANAAGNHGLTAQYFVLPLTYHSFAATTGADLFIVQPLRFKRLN